MFCTQCGASLSGAPRFCSSCGTPVDAPAAAQGRTPPPPRPNSTSADAALLNAQGYPQPAFERLAAALFHALDQAYQPQRSGGLEVSKMSAYRTLGGQSVSQYYGEYTLPAYASIVGIELIPNQPPTAPVVSWNGWHQFLLQKIRADPEGTFLHLLRVLPALKIPIVLNRAAFPAAPNPQAQAKETQFQTTVAEMARKAGLTGGGGGGGVGAAADQHSMAMRQRISQMRLEQAQSRADLMNQIGVNLMNSTDANGTWYTRRR